MKLELKQVLRETALAVAPKSEISFSIELTPPKDPAHGDLSSDLAFRLCRTLKQSPQGSAEAILPVLKQKISEHEMIKTYIDEVKIAPPGYFNFYFNQNYFASLLKRIYKEDKGYGQSRAGQGKRVVVEYVSANPTGPLTIAHGRQACVGDALARILKLAGHEPHREYYMNDGGRQIQILGKSLHARYSELVGEKDYPLPEDGYQGDYLVDIAKEVVSLKKKSLVGKRDSKTEEYFCSVAKKRIFEGIQKDLKDSRVEFDEYFSEQSLFRNKHTEEVLQVLKKRGKLYEKDGALWLKTTDAGDDKDRVLRKKGGEFTYLVPDIAYHRGKFERGYEWIVNLWGPDHHGYISRLKAAVKELGYDTDKVQILIVQLTTLFREGKPVRMSTRKGEFVTFRELLDEVGVDATRFFFLMRRIESHLDFDLDLAKKKSEDNPVFYMHYAHARIASILRRAEREVPANPDLGLLKENKELELIRTLGELPDIVSQAARHLEPYRVVDYLRSLAQTFHQFYTLHRVITDDEKMTGARLFLVNACRIVFRNGLNVLGVSAPERM